MRGTLDLSGVWQLSWSEDGPEALLHDNPRGHVWLPARVPGPVHIALMEAGILDDPDVGLNSLGARWVEEQFWVYHREFVLTDDALEGSQWLVFDWLEHDASVWINGQVIGRHANSHRKAVFDVTDRLRSGTNTIAVMVESGLHAVNDTPVAPYGFDHYARMTRRPLLRKAQYQCGWDWNPRLMSVGILGNVRLEHSTIPLVDSASVIARLDDSLMQGSLRCRLFVRWPRHSDDLRARMIASLPERGVSDEVEVKSAVESTMTSHEVTLPFDNAELWWPSGQGSQRLYEVRVVLRCGDDEQVVRRKTAFRRVHIEQSPHPEGGRYFVIHINGRPVFCKGANWVPPSVFPSQVSRETYEKLVQNARDANFNTLRVWGGAVFAPEALLEACDQAGIMLWHDFLFACAKYPGDDPAFVSEVEAEVTEAVRRMAHHPSLIVWCGNNEVDWGDYAWGYRQHRPVAPHHALFHHHIPAILAAEDGTRPYWPSSPWSADYAPPNDPTTGDQHPWGVSILDPGPADFHRYRNYVDRFANEGGVLGAGLPVTLRAFLPEHEQHLLSPSWVHHDNPIGYRASRPGEIGRAYETFRFWTGLDPLQQSMDDYALLSGLLQAEGLVEYISNYRRRMFSSSSAIFWMYNDSWPATHSWTIVDYYLRRRLAYHPVRRAFQPVVVVVVEEGDEIAWYGVNDSPSPFTGTLRYGIFLLAGGYPLSNDIAVELPPNGSVQLAKIPRSTWTAVGTRHSAAFGMLVDGDRIVAQHRLFVERFHDLEMAIEPVTLQRTADGIVLDCTAFAWGVCVDLHGLWDTRDNCFDLFPSVRYTLPWSRKAGEPSVRWVGSHALVRLRQGSR